MKSLALLLPVLVALQVGVQPALAWAWPVDGPVLRPFVLGDDPYAGGQHRGIDIGAPGGTAVRAPASGTVSFAGTVPTGGKTITIRTADGFAVTLQRLGSYFVTQGLEVGEGDAVGSVGDVDEPYVYLGVRKADEPDGYVDPVGLLPAARPAPAPDDPAPAEPVPAPSHPGSEHHEHVAPASVVIEQPSALPPEDPDAVPRARTGSRSAGARRPHTYDLPRARTRSGFTRMPNALQAPAVLPEANARVPDAIDPLPASSSRGAWTAGAAALLGLALLCAGLARRRREFAHAVAADRPSAVLLQRAAAPAEDADGHRFREEDHIVLHRDLERILLAEREALPDLDGNDDPAQVVDVADDPRPRCPPRRARTRALRCSVRPQRCSAFRSRRTSNNTSPRFAISNHHLRLRGRAESFV
jgi:peptidase M23-like protein